MVPPTRRLFAVADRRRWEPHTRGNFWHGKTASKIELRVKQENFETEQRLEKERRALLDEKQAAFEKERLVQLEEHHRHRAEVENVERLLDWRAGIRCDCCGFQGSSEADFLRHCRGKSHKRKGGSPPPVDGSTSTTSTSTPSCASSASAPVHSLLEFKLDLGEIRGASNHWHALTELPQVVFILLCVNRGHLSLLSSFWQRV